MEDRKQNIELPLYLKIQNFSITNSLKGKLPHFTPAEQEKLAFIQSMVIYCARQARHPAMYVNIGARTFDNKIKGYRKFVDQLIALGELDVNEPWAVGRFSKSYRIPADALASGFTTFASKKRKPRKTKDKTNICSPNIQHQQKCLSQLKARDSFISTGNVITDAVAKAALLKVHEGAGNFKKGPTVNRISNTILQVPKAARCNIQHRNGYELAEFDLRNAHPFLLIEWCSPEEKEAFAALISDPRTDIYNYVAAETRSKKDRDALKIDMMRYLNGGGHTIFDDFFSKNFPRLNCFIKEGGKSNAAKLQNLEAAIMTELGAWCAEQNLFFIVQHDGWVGRKDQGEVVSEKLKELITSRIGFTPNIDTKERFTTTEKRAFVSASYLRIKEDKGVEYTDKLSQSRTKNRVFPPWLIQKIQEERFRKYQKMKFLISDSTDPDAENATL